MGPGWSPARAGVQPGLEINIYYMQIETTALHCLFVYQKHESESDVSENGSA